MNKHKTAGWGIKRLIAGLLCFVMLFSQMGNLTYASAVDAGSADVMTAPESANGVDTESQDIITEETERTDGVDTAVQSITEEETEALDNLEERKTSYDETEDNDTILYVGDTQYMTLAEAMAAVPDGGTIYLEGALTVAQWPLEQDGKAVTIEGRSSSVSIPSIIVSGNWILSGETTLRSLTLYQGGEEAYSLDLSYYDLILDTLTITAGAELSAAALPIGIYNQNGELDASWLTVVGEADEGAFYALDHAMPFESTAAFQKMAAKVFGESAAIERVIYVAGSKPSGENPYDPGTKENPYTSLQEAYDAARGANSLIYLCGAYDIAGFGHYDAFTSGLASGWSTNTNPVILAGEDGASLPMSTNWSFMGNLGLYNVTIRLTYGGAENHEIFCNGKTVVIGGESENNIVVNRENDQQYYPTLFGGAESGTIESTDLTVNGGTYDRIYGGGFWSCAITGEAKLTVNGATADGTTNNAVQIAADDGLKTKYAVPYVNKSGHNGIIGGSAVSGMSTAPALGQSSLTISNLNNPKLTIGINGGDTDTAQVTITNSTLKWVGRDFGAVKHKLAVNISEGSVVSTVTLVENYEDGGLQSGVVLDVVCTDSIVTSFMGRQALNWGPYAEAYATGMKETYFFSSCKMNSLVVCGHYMQKSEKTEVTVDNCSFTGSAHIEMNKYVAPPMFHYTKGIKGPDIFITTDSTTVKDKFKNTSGQEIGVLLEVDAAMDTLDVSGASIQTDIASLNIGILSVYNAVLAAGNLSIHSFSGKDSTLRLEDGTAANLYGITEMDNVFFGAEGEITGRCSIIANCAVGENSFKKAADLAADLYYYEGKREKISTWIISAEELSNTEAFIYVDQSNQEDASAQDGTADHPFSSWDSAYRAVTTEKNTLVLMAPYEMSAGEDFGRLLEGSGDIRVTICANDGVTDYSNTAILKFAAAKSYNLYTDTILRDLRIDCSYACKWYTNGSDLNVEETVICSGNNSISLYGVKKGESVRKVNIELWGGTWSFVSAGESGGTVGAENADCKYEDELVTIKVGSGCTFVHVQNSAAIYGGLSLIWKDYTAERWQMTIGGTVYGKTNAQLQGAASSDIRDCQLSGHFYGPVTCNFTASGKNNGNRYHLYGNSQGLLAGQFEEGADIKFDYTSGAFDLADTRTVSVKKKPVRVEFGEHCAVEGIYATYASDLEKNSNSYVELVLHSSVGCITTAAAGSVTATAYVGHKDIAASQALHVIFEGAVSGEDSLTSFNVENFYGFGEIQVKENAFVKFLSPVRTGKVTIEDGGKAIFAQKATIGESDAESGVLQLSAGEAEFQSQLIVNGTINGAGGILSLNGSPDDAATNEDPGSYSYVTGTMTGTVKLYSVYPYVQSGTSQRLYVVKKPNSGVVSAANDSITITEIDTIDYRIYKFGNSKDYSIIYIDGTNGNDSNSGLSDVQAVASLEKAYELVVPGGTLVVCGSTAVSEWPQTSTKPVVITSCLYDAEKPVDYRVTKQAALTLPAEIKLKGPAAFECVTISNGDTTLFAAGFPVVFGVEETKLPLGVANFNGTVKSVSGSAASLPVPTSITIHAGTFGTVDPWIDQNVQTVSPNTDGVFGKVVMTGGQVDNLGVSNYTKPNGKLVYELSGGNVTRLGSRGYTGYKSALQNYRECYNLSGSFSCDAFYAGFSVNTLHENFELNLYIHDMKEGCSLPLICYGNSGTSAFPGKVNITVENAKVDTIRGGNNGTAGTGQENVTVNLKKGASVTNLYCEGTGSQPEHVNITVNVLDSTASIGTLHRSGSNHAAEQSVLHIDANNTNQEAPYDIRFLDGTVTCLSVASGSTVQIGQKEAGRVEALEVAGGGEAILNNGSVFPGSYAASEDKNAPSRLTLNNGSLITFTGAVTGYTALTDMGDEDNTAFRNGVTIKSLGYADVQNSAEQFKSEDTVLNYAEGVWSLADTEDTSDRNVVYVSSNGTDAAAGTFAAPVHTLAGAYKKILQLYRGIKASSGIDEEQKNQLLSSMKICIMDEISLGDTLNLSDFDSDMKVTVTKAGSEKGGIYFCDSSDSTGYTLSLPIDTAFENIVFHSVCERKANIPAIYANGHSAEVADSCESRIDSGCNHFALYGGGESTEVSATNLTVSGGRWQNIYGGGKYGGVTGDVTLNLGGSAIVGRSDDFTSLSVESDSVFGGGQYGRVNGDVTILINGGRYNGVIGGGHSSDVDGTAAIDFINGECYAMYGAGCDGSTKVGNTVVNIGCGDSGSAKIIKTFRGSGYRGGLAEGSGSGTAKVTVGKYAEIAGNAEFCTGGYSGNVTSTELDITGGNIHADLFAGGWGVAGSSQYGITKSATKVNISGGTVNGNIYGGGNLGCVGENGNNGKTEVNITDGSVNGSIYGGGKLAPTYGDITVDINMTGGLVSGSIFGGAEGSTDTAANVTGTVTVEINEVNIAPSELTSRDFFAIYGGGDVNGTVRRTDVKVTTRPGCRVFGSGRGTQSMVESSNVTLDYDVSASVDETLYAVYGGGNLGQTIVSHVTVNNWSGDVFGGGRGWAEDPGIASTFKNVLRSVGNFFSTLITGEAAYAIDGLEDAHTGETHVEINGKLIAGRVFGGGELATVGDPATAGDSDEDETGMKKTVTHVTIAEGAELDGNVFGGGCGWENANFAAVYGSTEVIVSGGTAREGGSVFGGGQNAPVLGGTNVILGGGKLASVFGGNETSGAITLSTNVTVPQESTATVTNLYGGGKEAPYDGTSTKVIIAGGTVTNAYGGGYGFAAAAKRTSVTVTGGRVETLYGGGEKATVTEKAFITVNVADTNTEAVGTLYCGNNLAEMTIQPTAFLTSGKIGTFYGGGNAGAMTVEDGLVYDITGAEVEIGTVYGGCNQADVTGGVSLKLSAGTYGTVYGGNNISGAMPSTRVELAGAAVGETAEGGTTTGALYGGGNEADTGKTEVVLTSGSAATVYGGGNNATVTESVTLKAEGDAKVTELYCGNNQAEMNLQPNIGGLVSGTVGTFYGGGNVGAMTNENGLSYTFNQPGLHYTYIIGGCNQANVTSEKGVTLTLANVHVDTVYAGCNTTGTVENTAIYIKGNVSPVSSNPASVFGGGRGQWTVVNTSNIFAQNGTVEGTLYGGSGYGKVLTANVTVQEAASGDCIVIEGSVFGAGYGESSHCYVTNVTVNTALTISDPNHRLDPCDLTVSEELTDKDSLESDTTISGETLVKITWADGNRKNLVSRIRGNVYGGGNMGQVGEGIINENNNSATVSIAGQTNVSIVTGYVIGDVYGGGYGKQADGLAFSPNMGAAFGTCVVKITGGDVSGAGAYVGGNVYGGGYQSRVYAGSQNETRLPIYYDPNEENGLPGASSLHANVLAAQVNILEQAGSAPIIIGESVFAGGAKGDENSTNPTVYTVVGDVEVNIIGQHGVDYKTVSTAIYFDQAVKNGGGIYGDGNLCLVNGRRTVNIRCFNDGYGNATGDGKGEKINKLKTFYSLQRADEVNVHHSKFVLRGAKDLVDGSSGDTLYSINRVGQLNMRQCSTIKLIRIVNLLGGLWSDEHNDTRYINRGNNGQNGYAVRNGVGLDYVYDENKFPQGFNAETNGRFTETELGSIRRMLGNNNRVIHYRNAYMTYVYGEGNFIEEPYNADEDTGSYDTLTSFNEICVANGQYLEVKKSGTEYGNVNGVFILSLLYATPGIGGGFVYANIGDADTLNSGSTGAFVCVTKDMSNVVEGEALDLDQQPYMIISHNVGGYRSAGEHEGDYTYYYWYIKGNKYIYDMNVTGYIGSADTEFESQVSLAELGDTYHYILRNITGAAPVAGDTSGTLFDTNKLVDSWPGTDNQYAGGDYCALELQIVKNGEPASIGYLTYNQGQSSNDGDPNTSGDWGLKLNDAKTIYGTGGQLKDNQEGLKTNDIYAVAGDTRSLEFCIVLHKGSEVLTEFKNVPLTMDFDVIQYKKSDTETYPSYKPSEEASEFQVNLYTSIIRLVPVQDVYLGSGRLYAGVSTNSTVSITAKSAFTAQFITKFMPSAFNSSTSQLAYVLTTGQRETYLVSEDGVGFTITEDGSENIEIIHVTVGDVNDYMITRDKDGNYSYGRVSEESQDAMPLKLESAAFTGAMLPAGTMVTLVAKIDDYTPTYWYYYCKTATDTLRLEDFTLMNGTELFSFEGASGGNIAATSSQRITESLSFIVDFSQTNLSEEAAEVAAASLSGKLRLLHSYTSSNGKTVDIMDGVTAQNITEGDETDTAYERSYPAVSREYTVVQNNNGISGFDVVLDKKSGYQLDTYTVNIAINKDGTVTNTRFGEREYAVKLELADADGNVISFPAGTVFVYNGVEIMAGPDNKWVSIPVQTLGTHTLTMKTTLAGFDLGEATLKATLYSSAEAAYYNELDTGMADQVKFTVAENPTFALRVLQEEHLYAAGDVLSLTIDTRSNLTGDAKAAAIRVFRYDKASRTYCLVELNDVFTDATENVMNHTWEAPIRTEAESGTYRLEFSYYDKTEYWDFIVK